MSVFDRFGSLLGDDTSDTRESFSPAPIDQAVQAYFDAMTNARRRMVVFEVAALGVDETIEIGDLATIIGCVENDADLPQDLTSKQRKRVYVALYQTHIPKLADLGLVDYVDADRNILKRNEQTRVAARLWRQARDEVRDSGVSA